MCLPGIEEAGAAEKLSCRKQQGLIGQRLERGELSIAEFVIRTAVYIQDISRRLVTTVPSAAASSSAAQRAGSGGRRMADAPVTAAERQAWERIAQKRLAQVDP